MALILKLLLAFMAPVLAEIEMKFTKYPESVTAPVGHHVTFECAVRVPGERLAWRWRHLDRPDEVWKNVEGSSDSDSVNKISTRLQVDVKDDTPNALYQCVVWYGAVSLASIPAKLLVARLEVIRSISGKRVVQAPVGNTVVLHCQEPQSEPPAVMSWWRESQYDRINGRILRRQLDTPYGVLIIPNVTMEDSGTYGCTATNELSGQSIALPETTHLKVQSADHSRGIRFLETPEYTGRLDNEGVLTVTVKVNNPLRLWCGAVDSPPPRVTWTNPHGRVIPSNRDQGIVIESFTAGDEGIYSCIASPSQFRRSWKVVALEAPMWLESAANVNASEGSSAHIACGSPVGHPPPSIHWLLNAEPLRTGKGIRASGADLKIDRVEKRHAGIVQCFACNDLGCAYDAALLTVVPMQISDQEYPAEASTIHFPSQPPKRHNRKNPRKHKAVLIPPSKPNVTRMSDDSVMVTWSHVNHGLPIRFFKIQYREVNGSVNSQWSTEGTDIPMHIHSYEIDQLKPDRYYKFRIAAVYSNQDNKQGKSSVRFLLQRGIFKGPNTPILTRATPISSNSIQLDWTWSPDAHIPANGFYVYYRVSTTAGIYDNLAVLGTSARSVVIANLSPDTSYELKIRAYNELAPSDFSSILMARTYKSEDAPGTTTEMPIEDIKPDGRAPGALVTAGGALGVAALLAILVVTLFLCRRTKRPAATKEKGSVPESGGGNGYIPAKVPITITANPMHAEGGDGSVEMSFLHNNNTGSNDDTLTHSRKNGPARQYV